MTGRRRRGVDERAQVGVEPRVVECPPRAAAAVSTGKVSAKTATKRLPLGGCVGQVSERGGAAHAIHSAPARSEAGLVVGPGEACTDIWGAIGRELHPLAQPRWSLERRSRWRAPWLLGASAGR